MKNNFEDKVAIITGAAGGIGTAIARLFDEKGIRCALCDINVEGLSRTAALLRHEALQIPCDITSRQEIAGAIAGAVARFGGIDILVNNAGVIYPSLFEDCAWQEMDRQIMINQVGAMRFARAVIAPLKQRGGGYIITVSSLAGIVPETYSAVYSATKYALRGFSLTLNMELRKHNIFSGAVFPDSIDTPMLRYEAEHGGSPLTFLSKPVQPRAVARAVYRAMAKKKIESYVPAFSATLPKILSCVPGLIPPIWRILEKMGEKRKTQFVNAGRRD